VFHNIPEEIRARMDFLVKQDEVDRVDGTARMERLRQIPPETGKFIALLAAAAPAGAFIEIGTSAGYSSLWLALACRVRATTLTTFELLEEKVRLAKETFELAGVKDVVRLIKGDARDYLNDCLDVGFCFLDAEKEIYADCYEAVVPKLVPGGILVADNAINHRETLEPMLNRALTDERVDAVIVPIGKGELVCRKI